MDWFLNLWRRSRLGYFADFAITPPLTCYLAWLSLDPSLRWLLEFCLGLFVWSFYEYAVHRWISHEAPVLRDAHWLHHRDQTDYIAIPPWATLTFYVVFWYLFGLASTPLSVGFSVGYVAYSYLHTAFHYQRIGKGHPLFRLKLLHVVHHRVHDKNFGVSSPLWDKLLGTYQCR